MQNGNKKPRFIQTSPCPRTTSSGVYDDDSCECLESFSMAGTLFLILIPSSTQIFCSQIWDIVHHDGQAWHLSVLHPGWPRGGDKVWSADDAPREDPPTQPSCRRRSLVFGQWLAPYDEGWPRNKVERLPVCCGELGELHLAWEVRIRHDTFFCSFFWLLFVSKADKFWWHAKATRKD